MHNSTFSQVITSSLWIRYSWYDFRLKWDPKAFGETKSVRFKRSEVWIPDMTVYNDVREEARSLEDYPVRVFSDGKAE